MEESDIELENLKHLNKLEELRIEYILKKDLIKSECESKKEVQRIKDASIRRNVDRQNFKY